MKRPFFSVIIPTYNRLNLLKKTLSSVMTQTFSDFEVLVVDNYSTDGTVDYMNSLANERIRYIRNDKNEERAFSRNRGLSLATGEFCTLLDSDDIMYPHCLQTAKNFIAEHEGVRFFHGLYDIVDDDDKKIKDITLSPLTNPYKQLCEGNFISCIAVFIKTELYQRFKFSEDRRMIGAEDYEIWLRMLVEYPIYRLSSVLCGMREHPGRSVYTDMYFSLEFQREQIIAAIHNNPPMKEKYGAYIHYINSNFYYHQAMFQFHLGNTGKGLGLLAKTVFAQPGILVKRRFAAMSKALFVSLPSKPTHRG